MEEQVMEKLNSDEIIVGLARLLPRKRGRPRLVIFPSRAAIPMLSLEGLVAADWYKARVSVLGQTDDGVVLLIEPVGE
jgi:hypothetical protein